MTQPTNIEQLREVAREKLYITLSDLQVGKASIAETEIQLDEIVTSTYLQAVEYGRISVLEDFDSIMKADAFMGLSAEEWKAVQKFFRYNDEISGWKQSLKQTKE